MQGFVGRVSDLSRLRDEYKRVRLSGAGAFVLLKGRRRVGKSWLVEEFIERVGAPSVFFLADRLRAQPQLDRFALKLVASNLPAATATDGGVRFTSWEAALRYASQGTVQSHPAVIVLDEFPSIVASDTPGGVEASVNAAWEQTLSRMPVMLVVIGSDFSVMQMLSDHDRPLFDRPTLVATIDPLNVHEFAEISGLDGAAAIDAYHVVGGFPRLARSWRPGWTLKRFLQSQLADQDAPLVAVGRHILDAEFPNQLQARTVLTVIGAGERTYGSIAEAADVAGTNLRRSLRLLEREKRVITSDAPLSAVRSEETRYWMSDPYLRFYVRFIDPALADIIRGRGLSVADRVARDWQAYLGKAIEPFVRQSLERLGPERLFGATRVGGYWTRTNRPEIDLVGVDDGGPPTVRFIGSIKWRDNALFDNRDTRELIAQGLASGARPGVPGMAMETPLVGVSRAGFAAGHGLRLAISAEELLAAWQGPGA